MFRTNGTVVTVVCSGCTRSDVLVCIPSGEKVSPECSLGVSYMLMYWGLVFEVSL